MKLLKKQHQFLFDTKHFQKAFIGGQGSGKTLVGLLFALAMSRINKNCAGVIVSPTYPMSRDIVQRELLSILDGRHRISPFGIRYQRAKQEEKIIFPQWNSEIWFRSADRADKLRGPNLAWALLDEAGIIKHDCFIEIKARVRDPKAKLKQIAVTTTPGDYKWLEKEIPPETTGQKLFIRAKTDENIFLDKEYAGDARETYDKKRQLRYLDGAYVDLYQDSVYYCFSKDRNILTGEYSPIYEFPVYVSCDFNRNPCVWLLAQKVKGKLIFFDEIFMESARTELMIKELRSRITENGKFKYQGLIVYGDSTSLSIRSTAASYSDFDLINQEFKNYPNYDMRVYNNPFVKDRIITVNKELENGNVLFTENMAYTIEDMPGTLWGINKYDKDKGKEKDKANGERTHATDCVDYIVYAEFNKELDSVTHY